MQSFSDSAFSSSSTSGELAESALDRLKSVEQKLKERVELLEFQVKAHRDDWEAELNEKRQALQDKEAAEHRATDLLTELQSLKVRVAFVQCTQLTRVTFVCIPGFVAFTFLLSVKNEEIKVVSLHSVLQLN